MCGPYIDNYIRIIQMLITINNYLPLITTNRRLRNGMHLIYDKIYFYPDEHTKTKEYNFKYHTINSFIIRPIKLLSFRQ